MMSELIEHSDDASINRRKILVGENNALVPFKVYQDIYHQITGRTEQIKQRYSNNLLIDMSELEQLHFKIMQLCEVHNIIANNETVTIFHAKEQKEQFTSFDRFKFYNSNTSKPTVNVVLKYNFSIIPSGLDKPQEYVITIRLSSRVTLWSQAERDLPSFIRGRVLNIFGENTAEIIVDYSDYVIARGFLEAFDEWIQGCNFIPKNALLLKLRNWSHLIPPLMKWVTVILIAFYALHAIPNYFGDNTSFEGLASFIVIYAAATFILLSASSGVGSLIENSIDTYPILSYLKLNKGDEKMINSFQDRRRFVILKFIISAIFMIFIAVIATKIERLL